MDTEPKLQKKDSPETSMQVQPSFLDSRFQKLLVFPGDFEKAVEKAGQLAGGRPINKALVQQALIMLDYDSLENTLLEVGRVKEAFGLSDNYKTEEIKYLVQHARSRDEFLAITGIKKVNELGIKRTLDSISVEIIQFLQNNFSQTEVTKICSSIVNTRNIYEKIKSGLLTKEKIEDIRTLFKQEELDILFDTYPEFLINLNLGRHYQPVTQETRNYLVTDYVISPERLESQITKKSYDQITPLNLSVLFSLDEEERMTLLKNPFIDTWLSSFGKNTKLILNTLKRHTSDNYIYLLRNCNDISLFSTDPQEFEKRLQTLDRVYEGGFPWKVMYPEIQDRSRFCASGISRLSCSAMEAVNETYGADTAKNLFLSGVNIYDSYDEEKTPLITRMKGVEKIVGEDNFKKSLKNKEFINLIDGISSYDDEQQRRSGRSLLVQMERAKEQFGEERFLLLCNTFGGVYFIRFGDTLVATLPKETLDLIFSAKSGMYPFFDVGFNWVEGGKNLNSLKVFASLPPERQKVLVNGYAVIDAIDRPVFADWIKTKSDKLVEKVLASGILPPDRFGEEAAQRVLSRIDQLLKIFGEDATADLLQKRMAAKTIYELPEKVTANWSVLQALSEEDRKFFFDNGLALEVLKDPSKADLLKEDYGARLSVFLDHDPLLRKQIEGLTGRLNELRDRGQDVDMVIRKMVKRLTDPKMTDTDKIWYLFTRVFGEKWLLKGTDPQLANMNFQDRFSIMKRRLEDIVALNEDPKSVNEADRRNRDFASGYSQSRKVTQPLLIHGKKDFYPQDLYMGYRAAEFLGVHQYQWDEQTANAINFMTLNPGQELVEAYYSQRDQITVNFGASKDNELGLTHVFLPADVEKAHGTYDAKIYDGKIHGNEHKLVLGGVPITTELCTLVNPQNQERLEVLKTYYSKKSFYVPLIDVVSGEILFKPEEYNERRKSMIEEGSLIDPKVSYSVDALINKVVNYYSVRDQVHGIKHIENTINHIPSVCRELFEQGQNWFITNDISYTEFENLVRIAVASHDIARNTKEDEAHAVAGAQVIADILDYGLSYKYLRMIQTAIKQHNLPKEGRWSDDPLTQALYDIDKADTTSERGADQEYIKMILPTIQSNYTRNILIDLLGEDIKGVSINYDSENIH